MSTQTLQNAPDLRNGFPRSPNESLGGFVLLPRIIDSFQTYLRRQTEAIRQKTGCDEVQFRVAEEDGKLKLKARPVPSR